MFSGAAAIESVKDAQYCDLIAKANSVYVDSFHGLAFEKSKKNSIVLHELIKPAAFYL
jgi:hypothetical protein